MSELDRESQMLKSWYGNRPLPARPTLKLPAKGSPSQNPLFSAAPATPPGNARSPDSVASSAAAIRRMSAKPFVK